MLFKFRSKFFYTIISPIRIYRYLFRNLVLRQAKDYLRREGVLDELQNGDAIEVSPVHLDLANMHKLVRRRKPQTVVEFGSGFSTVVIAHALAKNAEESDGAKAPPMLWSVEANEHWMKNTQGKIPERLSAFVSLSHSEVFADELNGQLCLKYAKLPNVVPDFIYLDGPGAADVKGEVRGLKFQIGTDELRRQVFADVLLYESSFHKGAFILVDSMYPTVHFLRHNLKREYRFKWDVVANQSTFELMEHGPNKMLPRAFWAEKTSSKV